MKKFDAVIAGYLCVDMVPGFQKNEPATSISNLLVPGKLIEIDGLDFSIGGVVANTGMAMKKFNRKVFLNGLIGNDFIGKIARDWLDKYNLSEGIKITDKSGTAFSIVLAPPGVDRIFLESPGCSTIFDNEFIDFDAVSQCRLFHFGYPPLLRKFYLDNGEQLKALFARVQEMGVATSLDFSLPDLQSESGKQDWPEIMRRVLPYTDLFVPSLEEILQIMRPDEYAKILSSIDNSEIIDLIPVSLIREIGRTIIDCGAKILLIKAGHRGIYLITGNVSSLNEKAGFNLSENEWNHREFWLNAYPADPAKIKNATGAGDTAAAAFISAILDNKAPEEAIKFAGIAGRNNLYCQDIYEEIDDWQAMVTELKTEQNEIISF
jgi:sugar/nucleoside kinase (ribokinase family)